MRRVLLTGGNKGIGFAIVERILEDSDDVFVFLGSRDRDRGNTAAERLANAAPHCAGRIEVVELDVATDESVDQAFRQVREVCGTERLYGIVNNAGIGIGSNDLRQVFDVNTRGIERVCRTFIPLVRNRGRIVNVTSAAGPNYVATCNSEYQRFFTRMDLSWQDIEDLMVECENIAGDAQAFASRGLGDGSPYDLSKALANAYTVHLAGKHPDLIINACTPGFISTDMTRAYEGSRGQRPEEMGAKTPREGATAPLFLLFGDVQGTGHYYGSDARRSPLDRYREPGSPAFTGQD